MLANTQQPIKQPGEYVDPFGGKDTFSKNDQSSVLTIAGGLQSELDRTWTDDTSQLCLSGSLDSRDGQAGNLAETNGSQVGRPLGPLGSGRLAIRPSASGRLENCSTSRLPQQKN